MAQNISPDHSQSSDVSKQNDEAVQMKDNHAVSKRWEEKLEIIRRDSFRKCRKTKRFIENLCWLVICKGTDGINGLT